MFSINKVIEIQSNPYRKEPVEMKILEMVEKVCPFKPVIFVDKKELPQIGSKRRFLIIAAHGTQDK